MPPATPSPPSPAPSSPSLRPASGDARRPSLEPSSLVSNRPLGHGWYLLRLRQETIARTARPGQFVQLLCAPQRSTDPLLRRPFSVCAVDREAGTYDILYVVVGRGTRWMAELRAEPPAEGLSLDAAGPLGNHFTAPAAAGRVLLVGGGVGIAPLYFLAREIRGAHSPGARPAAVTLCAGARTRSLLKGVDEFRALEVTVRIATEDGSEGYRGRVTELLAELLDAGGDPAAVTVYGCGPQGMNESLRALLVARGIRGEICLESLMACGYGVCFGCVAPIRKELGGPYFNRRVCWDGPVFDARLLHPGILP